MGEQLRRRALRKGRRATAAGPVPGAGGGRTAPLVRSPLPESFAITAAHAPAQATASSPPLPCSRLIAAITRDSRHKRRATGGRRAVHKKKRKFETGRPAAMTKLGEKRVHLVRARGGNTKFRAIRLNEGNFSWGSTGEHALAQIAGRPKRTARSGDSRSLCLGLALRLHGLAAPEPALEMIASGLPTFGEGIAPLARSWRSRFALRRSLPRLFAVIARKTRILDVVYNASNNELVRTKTLVKNAIVEIDATPFREWFEKFYSFRVPIKGKEAGGAIEVTGKDGKTPTKVKARQAEAAKFLKDDRFTEQFSQGRLLACVSSRPGQHGRADGYLLEGKELEFYSRQLSLKKKK